MRAGKLRHRITIQQLTTAPNTIGGTIETWSTFATAWAAKEDLKGREYLEAQKVMANMPVRFRIRYHAGIKNNMRVLYGTETYNITAIIDPDDRARELLLMCEEVV